MNSKNIESLITSIRYLKKIIEEKLNMPDLKDSAENNLYFSSSEKDVFVFTKKIDGIFSKILGGLKDLGIDTSWIKPLYKKRNPIILELEGSDLPYINHICNNAEKALSRFISNNKSLFEKKEIVDIKQKIAELKALDTGKNNLLIDLNEALEKGHEKALIINNYFIAGAWRKGDKSVGFMTKGCNELFFCSQINHVVEFFDRYQLDVLAYILCQKNL